MCSVHYKLLVGKRILILTKMDQCCDWQTLCFQSNQRLSHLLLTKLWADCTFKVGGDQPETITAHKFVLAMSSPVFEAMFYGSMAEGNGPIEVPDVQPEAFKMMLKYLYTDNGNIQTYQEASELYCAARKYMIPFIQQRCSQYMQWSMTAQNACFAYEFANLFEEKDVLKVAMKTIKRKTKEVLKEGSFYDASISTVAVVFSQSELNIESEIDLFKAAEKYAESLGLKAIKRNYENAFENEKKSRIVQRKKLKFEENEGNRSEQGIIKLELLKEDERVLTEEILKDMRKAIANIRFLTLSAQELASVASSTLLTQEEALTLMFIITGVNEPLPEGFCDIKTRRGLRHWSPDCGSMSPSYSPTSPAKPNSQQPSVPRPEVTYESICEFTVPNFKTRKRPVLSPAFRTEDYEWRIQVRPSSEKRPDGVEQKTLSVFVECLGPYDVRAWRCSATVQVEIMARGKKGLSRNFSYQYTNEATSTGYRNWVPWSTICDNASGFLVSNTLKVVVHVSATYPTNKTATTSLSVPTANPSSRSKEHLLGEETDIDIAKEKSDV